MTAKMGIFCKKDSLAEAPPRGNAFGLSVNATGSCRTPSPQLLTLLKALNTRRSRGIPWCSAKAPCLRRQPPQPIARSIRRRLDGDVRSRSPIRPSARRRSPIRRAKESEASLLKKWRYSPPHAFYGSSGGSIRIILNESSLTISNPGSLLVDRDVAIAGGYSETRNPTLMRIFSFIGASDRAGSGLQRIWSTWNEVYDSAPSLEERHSPASVTLTMPLDITPIGQRTFDFSSTIPEENSLLALISNTPGGFTPHELQEALGISLRVAQGRLKSLFDQKLLTRKKDGRFWRYLAR